VAELTSASIGGADLAYNAVAAALESSAKSAGLSRQNVAGAKPIEVTLVEYEGGGAWLHLSDAGDASRELAKMLAAPLAKTLRKSVTVAIVSGAGAGELEHTKYIVDVLGKVETVDVLPPDAGAGELKDRAQRAMSALLDAVPDGKVLHKQKRTYHHRPTTGNARLDRFIDNVRTAEKVEIAPDPSGKLCIRLVLPGGVKQMSFFSAAEVELIRAVVPLPPSP
jgi:hypothetical protein